MHSAWAAAVPHAQPRARPPSTNSHQGAVAWKPPVSPSHRDRLLQGTGGQPRHLPATRGSWAGGRVPGLRGAVTAARLPHRCPRMWGQHEGVAGWPGEHLTRSHRAARGTTGHVQTTMGLRALVLPPCRAQRSSGHRRPPPRPPRSETQRGVPKAGPAGSVLAGPGEGCWWCSQSRAGAVPGCWRSTGGPGWKPGIHAGGRCPPRALLASGGDPHRHTEVTATPAEAQWGLELTTLIS